MIQTLLIAEDEKMIRAGIAAMVKRSGVEVAEILEANNGEAALEILAERHVDAVFTDIRMPKMDGIELARRIQSLEKKPYVVAVSGYDDFSYAVEMMRNGVVEYLLKPVEREKIAEVLTMIEQKIQNDSAESRAALYTKTVQQGRYRVVMLPEHTEIEVDQVCHLPDALEGQVVAVPAEELESFLEDLDDEIAAGISAAHHGQEELQEAYREVREARQVAFCRGTTSMQIETANSEDGAELLSERARSSRIHLVGTDKRDEMIDAWNVFFDAVRDGKVTPHDAHGELHESLRQVNKLYAARLDEGLRQELEALREPLKFNKLDSFREACLHVLLRLQEAELPTEQLDPNSRKMEEAVAYIRENYRTDLNMAVVSNMISMNYSLFSYSFKQYTGENFVTFLKNLRMTEAKRLLAETDEKIIDVGQQVGYENYKHFLKLFRSEYGVSPTEYRRNMQHRE